MTLKDLYILKLKITKKHMALVRAGMLQNFLQFIVAGGSLDKGFSSKGKIPKISNTCIVYG